MALAEDIVEESFVKLWESQAEIRHEAAMYNWLCTTVKNKSLNELRNSKSLDAKKDNLLRVVPLQDENDHLERMLKAELITEIHQLIHSLPPQCSKVLTKLFIEDKSMHDASRELSLSLNTIRSHRARGLDLLRHKLIPFIILLLNL